MPYGKTAARFGNASARLRSRSEAGGMGISGVLLLVVVAVIVFAAFKILPPYIDNYRLQDTMDSVARNATYNRRTEAAIRQQIWDEARQLDIPLEENQIVVRVNGPSVNISAQYMVTVDLLVRQLELNFAPAAGNRNIMAKP
ncbi:MAG: DUF4845 domain-containing protein [Acidobacteria bacterium]|nr:DUF4845 domain-containing protein [Acidobacteriota bacterium]